MNDQPAGQDPTQPGDPGSEGPPPTEEELRAAFEEQMRQIRVEDVLLQTTVTLVNLAARKLGLGAAPGEDVSAERDLDQARLAIDGARALLPLCPPEQAEPIRQALSQLQMAFAQESGGAVAAPGGADPGQPGPAEHASGQSPEDAERAKARSKLWTPPGA
jgi:hypothetical protein